MFSQNLSNGEKMARFVMAGVLIFGVVLSLGAWFYLLFAVLLLLSGVTGQCAIIHFLGQGNKTGGSPNKK